MFLLPDPLYHRDQLSAASLFWFKPPLLVSLTSKVVTTDAFEVLTLVEQHSPPWARNLSLALNGWQASAERQKALMEDMEPLRERLRWVWLSYPAGSEAMERAGDLINQAGVGAALKDAIDPLVAMGELIRHVFLELWLENGQELERQYASCASVFAEDGFEQRLSRAYLFRLGAFAHVPNPLLLSNPSLLPLITHFGPSEDERQIEGAAEEGDDVAAFEIFRRIISPRLDPLTKPTIEAVADTLATREEELVALRKQCHRLAEDLEGTPREDLESAVEKLVNKYVADDLAAVLRLSDRAKQEFMAKILADKVAWTSLLSTIAGAETGTPGLTTAGGIGVIATILAKGVDAGWQFHKEIRDNPYRLIRRFPDELAPPGG